MGITNKPEVVFGPWVDAHSVIEGHGSAAPLPPPPDVVDKLRFVRDMGTRVILDQGEVIDILALIEEKQILPDQVKDFVGGNNIHLNESGQEPLLFFPEITMK